MFCVVVLGVLWCLQWRVWCVVWRVVCGMGTVFVCVCGARVACDVWRVCVVWRVHGVRGVIFHKTCFVFF